MYSSKKVYIDIAIKYSWACDQFHWTCRRFVIFISTSSMANFSLSWHEIAFRLTSSFSILYATCHLKCALHRMHKIFKACACRQRCICQSPFHEPFFELNLWRFRNYSWINHMQLLYTFVVHMTREINSISKYACKVSKMIKLNTFMCIVYPAVVFSTN